MTLTEREVMCELVATTPVRLDPAASTTMTEAASQAPTGRQRELFAWLLHYFMRRQQPPPTLPQYWRMKP